MKKMNFYKTIQLILLVLLTTISIALVLLNPDTRYYVAKNSHIFVICLLLWLSLIGSFVFLYLDFRYFTHVRKNVKELDHIAHADTIAGIPNRFSCDSLIEKYIGSPLPANMGCVMIDLTNIIEINQHFGREEGDRAIRQFSDTLHLVAAGQCFIGRNGGNKFIALFEDCDQNQLIAFTERFKQQIEQINEQKGNASIHYQLGIAFHSGNPEEAELGITDLISKANSRIYSNYGRRASDR